MDSIAIGVAVVTALVSQSADAPILAPPPVAGTATASEVRVKLSALDEFALEQLSHEITSLLNQIEIYLDNIRFEEEKAAQFGGVKFSPVIIRNTLRAQREELAQRLLRLNRCMQTAYGVSAPGLETLVQVSQTL